MQFGHSFHSSHFDQRCESNSYSSIRSTSELSGDQFSRPPPDNSSNQGPLLQPPWVQSPMQFSTPSNYSSLLNQTNSDSSRSYGCSETHAAQTLPQTETDSTTWAEAEIEIPPDTSSFAQTSTSFPNPLPPFRSIQPSTHKLGSLQALPHHDSSNSQPRSHEITCQECPRSFKSTRALEHTFVRETTITVAHLGTVHGPFKSLEILSDTLLSIWLLINSNKPSIAASFNGFHQESLNSDRRSCIKQIELLLARNYLYTILLRDRLLNP